MSPQKPQAPLKLGKRRRLGEQIAENLIRMLAFVSFAAIILIFVFVFKEASPIFFGKSKSDKPVVTDTAAHPAAVTTSQVATADTALAKMKVVGVIKANHGIKGTEITIKEDASGHKVTVSKGGGEIEQEVFDPLADDTPAPEPAKKPAADTATKVLPKKKPAPATVVETKKDTSAAKSKVYAVKSDGNIEQELFDPLADSKGVPTIQGQKGSQAVKKDSISTAPVAPIVGTDSLSLAQAKIEADSAAARERRDSVTRENATSFSSLFFGDIWQPVSTVPKYGFVPLFVGTLKVTLLSILFGAPLAILAALFTSTFAPKWLREILKPIIELLAGFPSVVVGFFALMVMATMLQDAFGYQFRLNAFVGGIAMSFAIIPIIYTISEDALTAVPQALRDASTALGATKWQTAFRVVLPSAIPGVFAAIILGFGRAFGETMIALMATGNASITSANPFEPIRTFAATIGAEMAEVVFGDQHYTVLFLIGALLFVFTFSLNALVEFYVRKRLIKRIQGK